LISSVFVLFAYTFSLFPNVNLIASSPMQPKIKRKNAMSVKLIIIDFLLTIYISPEFV